MVNWKKKVGDKVKENQSTDDVESDGEKSNGCICPVGCVVGSPIDPTNPGDAFKMTCSNGAKCEQILYLHVPCMELLEKSMLKAFEEFAGHNRRGSTWSKEQRANNLWNKKGYEILYRVCPCPCTGYLHKDMDVFRPAAALELEHEERRKKKKPQTTKQAAEAKPALNQRPWGYSITTVINDRHRPHKSLQSAAMTTTSTLDEYEAPDSIPGLHLPPPKTKKKKQSFATPAAAAQSENRWRRKDSTSTTKTSRQSESWEIESQQELINILNDLLPDGSFDSKEAEEATVNDTLQNATVNLLSEIEESGGIWEWLQHLTTGGGEGGGIRSKFKYVVKENGIVEKVEREEEIDGDGSDQESDVEESNAKKDQPPTASVQPSIAPRNQPIEKKAFVVSNRFNQPIAASQSTQPETVAASQLIPPMALRSTMPTFQSTTSAFPSVNKPIVQSSSTNTTVQSSQAGRRYRNPIVQSSSIASIQPEDRVTLDPDVLREADAHATLSSALESAFDYAEVLDEVRLMAKFLKAKTYWTKG